MGTEQDENSEIDVAAVNVVRINLEDADWNLSTPDRDKVGLDMFVNLLEDRHPQIGFFLQIKGMGPKTRKGKEQPLTSRADTLGKPLSPDEHSLRSLRDRRRRVPPSCLASPSSACAAWPRQAPETERARSGTIFSVSDRPTMGSVKRHLFRYAAAGASRSCGTDLVPQSLFFAVLAHYLRSGNLTPLRKTRNQV